MHRAYVSAGIIQCFLGTYIAFLLFLHKCLIMRLGIEENEGEKRE